MSLQSSLEEFHGKVISNNWLKLFTAILRGWLAIGFIHAGARKAGGAPFASEIPRSEPIGAFF